jgi:prepilin-type processing-associated H-X9-DG protein
MFGIDDVSTFGDPKYCSGGPPAQVNPQYLARAYPATGNFPAGYSGDRPIKHVLETNINNVRNTFGACNATSDGIPCPACPGGGNGCCCDRTGHLHSGVGNYIFADGHVKGLKVTTMMMWTASSN